MKSVLKRAVRHLLGKPVYSLITFTGFTFGIVASLLIYIWVFNELQYEKFHPGYKRIYRVLTLSKQGDEIVKSPACYMPVPKTMKKDYPQIEYATFLNIESEDSPLQLKEGGEKIEARMGITDDDFFKVFAGFRFLEGSRESAFEKPDNIILSEKTARKLFGKERALGKTLLSDKIKNKVYTVGGIVRIPAQSHIDFGFLVHKKSSHLGNFSDTWSDRAFVRVYIKLTRNAIIDEDFLNAASNHITRYSGLTDKIVFQPLANIHLHSDYPQYFFDKNPGDIRYVWIFSGLAFLIILMASFNFSVLSVARASEQSTEIGIRKAFGAKRSIIFKQFMTEAVAQTIVAAALGLLIIILMLPWFRDFPGKDLTLQISWKFLIYLLLLTLIVGGIAGAYPSLHLSSINPDRIFRKGTLTGSKSGFIRLLVTLQFSIAVFFMISMTLFTKQLSYIQNKDLGIERKNIAVIPTGLWYDNDAFKQELLKNPVIMGVSASTYAPADYAYNHSFPLNHQGITDTLKACMIWVDEDFANTYQLKVLKGSFLQMDNSEYWEEISRRSRSVDSSKSQGNVSEYDISIPIVINQKAEAMLGFDDPVGQRIGDDVIVGVVKDFHYKPMHSPIEPLIMSNNPENIMTMNVRIAPGRTAEALEYIRNTYRKFRDNREFSYRFFDDLLNEKYQAEKYLKNMTVLFALLAVVISVLGIFGMAVFAIDRRTKEIGIRKIFGSDSIQILILLNKDFIIWVFVAFFIAAPFAWYAMHNWLQNFAYKTALSWWIFALAGLTALAISLITISWKTWNAATRNPVESLRYE